MPNNLKVQISSDMDDGNVRAALTGMAADADKAAKGLDKAGDEAKDTSKDLKGLAKEADKTESILERMQGSLDSVKFFEAAEFGAAALEGLAAGFGMLAEKNQAFGKLQESLGKAGEAALGIFENPRIVRAIEDMSERIESKLVPFLAKSSDWYSDFWDRNTLGLNRIGNAIGLVGNETLAEIERMQHAQASVDATLAKQIAKAKELKELEEQIGIVEKTRAQLQAVAAAETLRQQVATDAVLRTTEGLAKAQEAALTAWQTAAEERKLTEEEAANFQARVAVLEQQRLDLLARRKEVEALLGQGRKQEEIAIRREALAEIETLADIDQHQREMVAAVERENQARALTNEELERVRENLGLLAERRAKIIEAMRQEAAFAAKILTAQEEIDKAVGLQKDAMQDALEIEKKRFAQDKEIAKLNADTALKRQIALQKERQLEDQQHRARLNAIREIEEHKQRAAERERAAEAEALAKQEERTKKLVDALKAAQGVGKPGAEQGVDAVAAGDPFRNERRFRKERGLQRAERKRQADRDEKAAREEFEENLDNLDDPRGKRAQELRRKFAQDRRDIRKRAGKDMQEGGAVDQAAAAEAGKQLGQDVVDAAKKQGDLNKEQIAALEKAVEAVMSQRQEAEQMQRDVARIQGALGEIVKQAEVNRRRMAGLQ